MPKEPIASDQVDRMPIGPFLGRRIQVDRLCRAVEEAMLGRGSRFWLVGPVGIGKSRLLAEIAQYAAWRRVPVGYVRVEWAAARSDPAFGARLVVATAVGAVRPSRVDDELCRAAASSALALATATSMKSCVAAGIPESALIEVGALDSADALRLLESCLGSEFESTWARNTAESAKGHPGRLRRAAAKFLETRRRRRTSSNAYSSLGK